MNLLFSINSANYKPISFRERYFYDYYEIVDSFLTQKLAKEDKNRLLKPMLIDGGKINWYGNYEGEFKRLHDYDIKIADKVKFEFNDFIKRTSALSENLKYKQDVDNIEWSELISNLFQHERIILISNELGDWGVLWGWDFMSNNENKLPQLEPTYKPDIIENTPPLNDVEIDTSTSNSFLNKNTTTESNSNTSTESQEIEDSENGIPTDIKSEKTTKIYSVNRLGFFGTIKRWLRWISYRFWALFWLIIYTLLIIWLCKKCERPNCDAYCEKLKKTKKELLELEERVRERCDTTFVKPN